MTFFQFLNLSLIENKYISINLMELGLLLLTIAFGFYFQLRAKKIIYRLLTKNKENKGFVHFLYSNIIIFLWSLIGIAIFSLSVVDFWNIEFFKGFGFEITSFDIFTIGAAFAAAVIFEKYIRIIFVGKNKERGNHVKASPLVFILLGWLIFIIITLRAIFADYQKVVEFSIFRIKKVDVTISDFFYMFTVIAITALVLVGLKRFLRRQIEKEHLDLGTSAALFQVAKYILWILAIITTLEGAGFKLSILLAGSAALLVGLGSGIQKIFSDIASGFILLIERTLKVSDVVDVGGVVGKVVKSGIRTTTILTRDHVRMIIPNSKFTSEPVINMSNYDENTRFKVDVGVAYGSDIQLVKASLLECALAHSKVSKKPLPFVRFNNFGNSSLDFQLFFWTRKNFEVPTIQSDLRFMIDEKFRENQISIPFPQRDVYIKH